MSILQVQHLEKTVSSKDLFEPSYKKTLWKVPELTLTEPGLYLLAGRNGCGKSTFLRCTLGLIRADSGTALWFGQPHLRAGDIGYVPEFPILPPAIPVKHWLSWLLGMPWSKVQEQQSRLQNYPKLQIQEFAHVPAHRLSKGQQQRVQFWNALIKNPKVVILDEPFSGLDPWARAELSELLLVMQKENKLVLLSSHEMTQNLRQVCKKTLLVENETIQLHDGCVLPQ